MNREEAKIEAKSRLGEYLSSIGVKVKGNSGSDLLCPICKHKRSGSGSGTFSYRLNQQIWKCWHSQKHGDIFDLYGEMNGIDGKSKEAFRGVYDFLGITVEDDLPKEGVRKTTPKKEKEEKEEERTEEEAKRIYQESLSNMEEWRKHLKDKEAVEYLKERGISIEVAERFGLGFAKNWRSPTVSKKVPSSSRLIIPNGNSSYIARAIGKEKYRVQDCLYGKGGKGIFNELAIMYPETENPVYVVEGWADALSIIQCGGSAVALCSTSQINTFVENYGKVCVEMGIRVVVSLDNDTEGKKYEEKLLAGLSSFGVDCVTDHPEGESKDSNEAMVKDMEGFRDRLITTAEQFEKRKSILKIEEGREREEYIFKNSVQSCEGLLFREMEEGRALTPTGFPTLDYAISGLTSEDGGGLPSGLYVLGAKSGCGKTTFLLQMADQMAEQGRDILFFSLEMSRLELVRKSISRLSFLKALENYGGNVEPRLFYDSRLLGEDIAYSQGDIRDFKMKVEKGRLPPFSEGKIKSISKDYFERIGGHIFIREGEMGGTGVREIEEAVETHKKITGKTPVVFIDYLQMLSAPEGTEKGSDKSIMDKKILSCKVLSRKYNTPVIAISSLNRGGYNRSISFEAFKESGSIEYSADVVLGMQMQGMADTDKAKEMEAKAETAKLEKEEMETERENGYRRIEIRILKNRSGSRSQQPPRFLFYPCWNSFLEDEEEIEEE